MSTEPRKSRANCLKRFPETGSEGQPYPLLFAALSGAHLYGFPSPDSDYDVRGAHILPLCEVTGLDTRHETIEFSGARDGREIDLVTHDVRKFFLMLLKRNGYVLEQLYLAAGPPHDAGACGAARNRPRLHHAAPRRPLSRIHANAVGFV